MRRIVLAGRDLPCNWPVLRLEVLRRDGHRCRSCGKKSDRESLEATPSATGRLPRACCGDTLPSLQEPDRSIEG